MTRPRVICHMMASIDGRIDVTGWPLSAAARKHFEQVHASYKADGWICGRITMEHFANGVRSADEVARQHDGTVQREDFIAPGDHRSFAIAVDPSGRLAWGSGDIDGDHVVVLLSERVSDDYLRVLREGGVSYLLAGSAEIDLSAALAKLHACFGVKTLMLEGGGRVNGSFLRAGLVDEVSVLVVPVVDGRAGTPTLFDGDDVAPCRLALIGVEQRADEVLWLRYRIDATDTPDAP